MKKLRNLKLKARLIVLFLIAGIIPVTFVAVLSLNKASHLIEEEAFAKLDAVQQIKTKQVETYFKDRINDIKVYSNNSAIILSSNRFNSAYANGGINGSDWNHWDQIHGPKLRLYSELYNYYDLFFVSKNGDIVWSAEKESDLGKNVHSSYLKDTPIRKAFVKGKEDVYFTDTEWYEPSKDPVNFISAPIHDNGELVGVLIYQLSTSAINQIMAERTGLGETGETYLVGADKLMRSSTYHDPSNHNVKVNHIGSVSNNGADTESVREALKGHHGIHESKNYMGTKVASAYAPVHVFGDIQWAIVSEMHLYEILHPVTILIEIVVGIVAVFLIGLVFMAIYTGRSIAKPITKAVDVAKSISKGDLSQSLNVNSNDEIGELSDAFDEMTGTLQNKAEVAQAISQGNIDADVTIGCDDDSLGYAMVTMRDSIKGMVRDVETLVMAAKREDFSTRADASKHSGEYHNIINGINEMMEAVTGKIFWFEQMLDAMPLMVSVTDNDLNWTFFNKPVEDAIGKKRGELIGTQCSSWGTEICSTDGCAIAQFKKNNPQVEFKYAGLEIQANSNKILNAAGEQIGYLEVIQDVTAQRRIANYMENMVVDISDKLSLMAMGDLSFQLKVLEADNYTSETKKSFDDIGVALNGSLNSLNDVLGQIQMASQQVNSGAQQVSGASQSLSQGATEQASSLEEVSSSMTEIGSQVKLNADNASQASKLTETARNDAHNGDKQMQEMLEAMNVINDQSSEVQKIIKVIDEIAFQTNLLALNAAVEAARAGVHGKGFAVVAEEVRNLAQRSAKAAKETTDLIEGNVQSVHRGVEIAENTANALTNIVNGITKATDLVNEISSASREQSSSIDQITEALGQIDQVTQANTANAEESAAAAEELSGQSNQMQEMIGRFKLANGHATRKQIQGQYRMRGDNGADYGNGNRVSKSVDPQPEDIVFNKKDISTKVMNPEEVISLDDEDFAGF